MFSRLSSLFAQAAEATSQVLTGLQSREEELQVHWKTIQEILVSDKGDSDEEAIQDIEHHLECISDLISNEDEERKGSMGPCMEFMLRHKLLDMLVTTAKTDYPQGMRKVVLKFLSVLLGRADQQLLPHVNVHRPINQLIKTCGLSSNNPLAAEELMFLRTLCVKLQQDSTLANFFIEETKGEEMVKFVISEAFMKITLSEDSLVCIKAFECLLVCVSLPDPIISQAIAQSQFPLILSSKLRQHLQLVPNTLHYTDIINCKAGWGVNNASTSAVQCVSPSPQRPVLHLEAYLSWLDYCEQIIVGSPQILQDVVCSNINELVIVGVLQERLTLASEPDLVVNVAILRQTLTFLTHSRLKQEFIDFIFTHFWDTLIQCCNHLNDDVCCSSLVLVHTLLSLPLLPRILPLTTPPSDEPLISNITQLEQCIERYLSIVPNSCQSTTELDTSSDLTHYLLDAHYQIQKYSKLREHYQLSLQQSTNTDTRQSNSTSGDWTEFPLMTVLLDRLERLLDQTYDTNLLVTAVLSHLAALSLPHLNQYVFTSVTSDDHTPHSDDHTPHRTIYEILIKVRDQLLAHTQRSPGLAFNIVEARRRLNGQETSDLLSMPNNELLEGAIVLEEFTKELACILFVYYSNSLLSSGPSPSVPQQPLPHIGSSSPSPPPPPPPSMSDILPHHSSSTDESTSPLAGIIGPSPPASS